MKTSLKSRYILFVIIFVLMTAVIALTAAAQTDSSADIPFSRQFRQGNIAVTDFNSTDGLSLYSKSIVRHEKQIADNTVFTYEGADSSYPRVSNKDGIYISGTYDNSAIVFFVKETENETKSLSVKTKNINEVLYFADIASERLTHSSVSIAVSNEEGFAWKKIIADNSQNTVTTDIYYTDCPFDNEKNAYMIALRVDNGMTCFESIQLEGLEILEITDCRKTLFYKDGILMQGDPDSDNSVADASVNFSIGLIRDTVSCTTNATDGMSPARPIITFLQNLYNFMTRVVNIILSIFR